MRVLLSHKVGGAFWFITEGCRNALQDKGHQVERWDGNAASWDAFDPDLYIGCSGHRQPIPASRGKCKIAIHVNPFGPVNIPGINEGVDSIKWVTEQKPDAVFGYGDEDDRLLWSYWEARRNIPWVPMPTAADRIVFNQITGTHNRHLDVVYLGGRWPYKAKTIDAFLFPVLNSGLKCRVHGWGEWPNNLCSGGINDERANEFLNSGKLGPCIAEQHTHDYGIDIPERAFKVAVCGTVVIHDSVPAIKRYIPSAIVARNPSEYLEMCLYYARGENEAERIELAGKQQSEVFSAHTYHHRMAALFKSVGFVDDSERMV